MPETPLVSVGIACYNGERFLREAIDSVLSQTYPRIELIVVDDGSTTDTVKKICDGYAGRLRYVRQRNMGLSGARNTGIREGSGEFFAFIDDDDIWLPQKIEKQIKFYYELKEKGHAPGFIYTGLIDIDENGKEISRTLFKAAGNCYKALMFMDFGGSPSAAIVPKEVLRKVGLFDEKIMRCDWDLWLRIAKEYEIYSFNEYLTKYRNTPGSLSKKIEPMLDDYKKIIEKNLVLMDEDTRNSLKDKLADCFRGEAADRWKMAAYERLFYKNEPKTFRQFFAKAYGYRSSVLTARTAALYLASYLSVPLCSRFAKLRMMKATDTLMDVRELEK